MRKVSALLMAGVLAFSLVGCGGNSDSDNKTTSDTSKKATSSETKKEDEHIKCDLTVWSPSEDQSPDYGEWLQTQCKAFAAEHPNWEINFKYGVTPEGDAAKVITQDVDAAADVFMMSNDQLTNLLPAKAVARIGGETEKYVKETNTQAIVDSLTVDGALYGVPFTSNTWFMYYDKSVFSDDDIKNLDTMLKKGKVSFPITNSWYLSSFYLGNGCTLFGDGTDADAGIDYSGKKGSDVTDYIVDLLANKNFVVDVDGSGIAGIRDGSVKAMFSGSWDYAAVKKALGDNIGVAQLPKYTLNGEEKQMYSFAGSKALGVSANTKNPEVAVALAKYLGSPEAQKSHYEARNIVPCNTELLKDSVFEKDILVKAQNDTINNTSFIQPFVAPMANYWIPTDNFGKSLRNGEVTHKNAAESTEAWNKNMNTSAVN